MVLRRIDGKTPTEAYGIEIKGQDRVITLIQAAVVEHK